MEQRLGYLFCSVQSVTFIGFVILESCGDQLIRYSGNSCGSIALYAFERQTRFREGTVLDSFIFPC